MRPGIILSTGVNPAALRSLPDKAGAAEDTSQTSRLAYTKPGISSGRGLAALQHAKDSGNRLNEGKAKSRSLLHELARNFGHAMRDLGRSIRESIRTAIKPAGTKATPPPGANRPPMGPNAERVAVIQTLTSVLSLDVKTGSYQCPAMPKLLHAICSGQDFSQSTQPALMNNLPISSRQELLVAKRVIEFMQSPPAAATEGQQEIGRDEGIVQITQQVATLLPDQLKSQCAPLLDGLNTANFPERSRQLAAMLQPPTG